MSRPKRVIYPGTPYHFISRFVASEWFIETNHERQCYLQLLGDALMKSDWRCFSFAIMSNHIHLGLLAGEDTLASWIRDVHSTFAEWINDRRDRIGAVFVRGPKMLAVRPDGVSTLMAYIHQNPVRAGVVAHPALSDWTSHAAYVGSASVPPWLDTTLGLELGGWRDGAELDHWTGMNEVDRKRVQSALRDPPRRVGRPRKSLRDLDQRATDAEGALASCTATPAGQVDLVSLLMRSESVATTRESREPDSPGGILMALDPTAPREVLAIGEAAASRELLTPCGPLGRGLVVSCDALAPLGREARAPPSFEPIGSVVAPRECERDQSALVQSREQRTGVDFETAHSLTETLAVEGVPDGRSRFGMRRANEERRTIRRIRRTWLRPRRRRRRRSERRRTHRARDGDHR